MDGQGQHPDTDTDTGTDADADADANADTAGRDDAARDEAERDEAARDDPRQDETRRDETAQGDARREAPPLGGRIHYLLGGTLPPRYSAWVSNDLTGPGWRIRQALRPFFLMVPFAVVFALLPGQVGVRVTIVVFLLVSGLGLGFATSGYFRNRRLEQHNFPPVFPPSD